MSQPQPPLDEQGEARDALTSAVTNYGPRILQNPQILGNVVTDLLPDLPREQNLLIAAAEADVATDLDMNIRDRNLDPSTAVQLAAHTLADKKSIDPAASMWVTTEYAKALGYKVPAYVPQSIPSAAPVSVPHMAPPQSVPPSGQSVPPQSVPPYGQSVPPQSVPPYGQSVPPQSVPPWSQSAPSSPSPTGQQSVPPAGGYGGGAPTGQWPYGPGGPGGPPAPPDNSKKNRGLLIGAIAAAAVVIIAVVAVVAVGGSKPAPPPPPAPTTQAPSSPPTSPSPTPTSSGLSNQQVANDVAAIVVGNGPLGVMTRADGTTATRAICDPTTVSNPPDPSAPTTASCDITYSDLTTWRQTVTVNFDSGGNPISDSTNPGMQVG